MINLHTPLQIQKNNSAVLITSAKTSTVRKKTLSKKVELGMNSLVVLIGIFLGFMTLAFLVHSNKTATTGYQLRGLEARRMDLIIANEVSEMQIAKLTSLENLMPRVADMTPVGDDRQFIGEFTVVAGR